VDLLEKEVSLAQLVPQERQENLVAVVSRAAVDPLVQQENLAIQEKLDRLVPLDLQAQ
jgi:hypothetical protein